MIWLSEMLLPSESFQGIVFQVETARAQGYSAHILFVSNICDLLGKRRMQYQLCTN